MITIEQMRAARAMLGLKQTEVAKAAGISVGTLNHIECGVQKDPKISTMRAIQQALEARGIIFNNSEIDGPSVRLKTIPGTANEIASHVILIIDDNEVDRTLYRTWLTLDKKNKYKIVDADNAQQGYEAFIKHEPDCIILDFMMYGKSGFQMLVEMKAKGTPIPPILFVTAMPTEAVKNDVMALGVHAYMDKHKLTKEKLRDAVAEALS